MAQLEGLHIQRTQRQHSSVVVVIPIAVRRTLGIKAGDYVIFTGHPGTGVVELVKFRKEAQNHAGDNSNPDREDHSR